MFCVADNEEQPLRCRVFLSCALLALTGCASLSEERLAHSSYGCVKAVVREKVPENVPDKHRHCLAGGLIARYCSPSEAYLAGLGKELSDLLGPGDAEWTDWQADRAGVRCARKSVTDEDVAACCTRAGY